MLGNLVDPGRGVMTEMETCSVRWEIISGTIFTKAQWFLLMENTWQKEEVRTWHVSPCIAGNESINTEWEKGRWGKPCFTSLEGIPKWPVGDGNGEENRKGFRKNAAENYLPAEQHPGWPWLGQQRVLVSKGTGKLPFRCVCDSGHSFKLVLLSTHNTFWTPSNHQWPIARWEALNICPSVVFLLCDLCGGWYCFSFVINSKGAW